MLCVLITITWPLPVRRLSVHTFERLLLLNPWSTFFQTLCELKISTNGHQPLSKMAAVPIYGKIHLKPLLSRTKKEWSWILVYNIGYSRTTKYIQTVTLGWHLTFFTARSDLRIYAFVWGKYWKIIFSKSIKDWWLKLTMYDQSSSSLVPGYIHV